MPLSKDDIKTKLDRHKKLDRDRGTWANHWQELAEIFLPFRASFTRQINEGQSSLTSRLYDSTPMLARRSLASAIDGLLRPKTHRWFHIRPADKNVPLTDEIKLWLDDAEDRLWNAIYHHRSRFIERTGEVDDDLVTFGTGCLFTGTSSDGDRLLFKSYHLKRVFIQENSDGLVDTVHIELEYTARQAAHKWGEKALQKCKQIVEALKDEKEPDKKFKFLWCVEPRYVRDASKRDNLNFPYADYVIALDDEESVAETGHHEFPFAIPRWDTSSEELYGRSPAMLALPDGNTLEAMGKTILVAGQKSVDPPLMAASDSVVGAIRTYPGGITYFDAEAVSLGNRNPMIPLETGAKLSLGREMQADVRDQIWVAFFRDVLRLPMKDKGNPVTATEILEKKDEFLRVIGPVFGRLEGDYIAPTVERCFNIMWRAKKFLPLPEALAQVGIKFEYASPVEQARMQIEAAGAARSIEILMPVTQQHPELLDNYDFDRYIQDTPETFGFRRKWLRSGEQVEQIRGARAEALAQQQQAAHMLEAAKAGGGIAKLGEMMTAPKRVIRDKDGNITGVESVQAGAA